MNDSEIWFVRHAQSITNAGQVVSDTRQVPLSEKGFRQRVEFSKIIPYEPDLIVATPYIRTQQTSEPTRARFPKARYEIWPLHEFGSLSLANYANKTSEQRKPFEEKYWERNDPDYVEGAGAESFSAMTGRIKASFQKLQEAPEKFIVVFTHGRIMQAMRFLMARQFMTDKEMMTVLPDYFEQNDIRNCAILRAKANENSITMHEDDLATFEAGFNALPRKDINTTMGNY